MNVDRNKAIYFPEKNGYLWNKADLYGICAESQQIIVNKNKKNATSLQLPLIGDLFTIPTTSSYWTLHHLHYYSTAISVKTGIHTKNGFPNYDRSLGFGRVSLQKILKTTDHIAYRT
jgi:hypothetical protein